MVYGIAGIVIMAAGAVVLVVLIVDYRSLLV